MSDFPNRAPARQSMLARAVNAMVRAMGGGAVKLRMPTSAAGLERELGIAAPTTEEVEVSPVVVRELGLKDGRVQVQVLISANSMQPVMDARGTVNGLALLRSVESMAYGERVFRVMAVSAETFAGMEYLWRMTGVE